MSPTHSARALARPPRVAFILAAATILLLGWEAGVMVAAGGPALAHRGRRPPVRLAYHPGMFDLSAPAARPVSHAAPVADAAARRFPVARRDEQALLLHRALHERLDVAVVVAELAHAAGKDPYRYRRELISRTQLPFKADMIKALDMAAAMSGWGKPVPGGTVCAIALGSRVAPQAELQTGVRDDAVRNQS